MPVALHEIQIHKAGPNRIPSITLAPLAEGDTITFVAGPDADSLLCFSAATLGVLTPTPEADHVELAGGASASFTVGKVDALNYAVVLQAKGWPVPASIHDGDSTGQPTLVLKKADGADFPDPQDSGAGTRTRP